MWPVFLLCTVGLPWVTACSMLRNCRKRINMFKYFLSWRKSDNNSNNMIVFLQFAVFGPPQMPAPQGIFSKTNHVILRTHLYLTVQKVLSDTYNKYTYVC